jgi:hypothetical protein
MPDHVNDVRTVPEGTARNLSVTPQVRSMVIVREDLRATLLRPKKWKIR